MKQTRTTLKQRLGFFFSAWLVFLAGFYIVFSQSGMFDRSVGEDPAPYVGFDLVGAIVGALLWRVASQAAKEGKVRIF